MIFREKNEEFHIDSEKKLSYQEGKAAEEFRPDYDFEFVCRKITKTSSVPTSRPDSGK